MEMDRDKIVGVLWYGVMMIVCFLLMVYFGATIGKCVICFREYVAECTILGYILFVYSAVLMFVLETHDFVLAICGFTTQIFESEIAEKIRNVLNKINIKRITDGAENVV